MALLLLYLGFAKVYKDKSTDTETAYIIAGFILIAISVFLWIKIQIQSTYKNRAKDKTIDIQKQELEEKEKIIAELENKLSAKSKILHKYNTRFSAYEMRIQKIFSTICKTEMAEELSISLTDVRALNKDLSTEILDIENFVNLQLTNIWSIDSLFAYMKKECDKYGIKFNLVINDNILFLIENHIQKAKLETLFADHIQDSIIAINSGNKKYCAIMVIIRIVNKCYEIKILDSGIGFEIDTLLKLGLEATTTHKNTGGTGTGFMTTFETLQECNASLIIEEKAPNIDSYSKAVIIRFDGKNEYKINSYRSKDINSKNKGKRIIIE